ncbi:multidrug resistance protein [Actinomadura verrucosospora]|uniref:Multidrug resistance protein n=1 Tax=Actinomadura verrucosospora TaxID=46165 RepID=A0A7D3W3G9_ACTVE|nr:multidrug resistance protein [Actinomadura verrucosospora]
MPAGLIVDRYNRWRIMVVSQVVRVLNSVLLLVALATVAKPWPCLIAATVVDGSCAVFFRIAELAAVRYVVPDGQAEKAMGASEARHHVALVLGRPVGGLLLALARPLPYLLDAVTSVVSVGTLFGMRNKKLQSFEPEGAEPKGGVLSSFKEGVLRLCRDRFLSASLVACAVANMCFQMVILLLVFEAERRHFPETRIGGLLGVSGFCGFLGAVTAPGVVRRFEPKATVKWCVVLWVPFLGIVALTGNPLIGMCAWGICSFMGAYINVALAVHQSRKIPKELQGRVEGVVQFVTTGAVALGASAGGYVIDFFGSRATAAAIALVFLAIAIAVPFVLSWDGRAGEPTLVGLVFLLAAVTVWSRLPLPGFMRKGAKTFQPAHTRTAQVGDPMVALGKDG